MKRLKKFASGVLAVACAAAMLAALTGCASQQAYVPPELTPTVSSPVIAQDGVLRVGVNAQNAPLAGQPSGSSKIVGIDVDVAAALAERLGLKLEVVDVGSDAAGALKDGTVDVAIGVDKEEAGDSCWTSDAYIPSGVALFTEESNTTVPTDADKPSVAAQVSSKSAWAVTNEFEDGNLEATDDLQGAFEALTAGEVSYVAADAVIGTYAAHSEGINTHIVALMQKPSGYAIGVLDKNAELKQAVSDALFALQNEGIIAVIQTKWLGTTLDLDDVELTKGATESDKKKSSDDEDKSNEENSSSDSDTASDETSAADSTEANDGSTAGQNAVQPDNAAV